MNERKRNPDIRNIIVYGKDYLSHVAFKKYWKKIPQNDIVEITDSDKDPIRNYVINVAQKLSPHIASNDKMTRNIFQNAGDVENLHNLIKASI